MFFWLSTPIRVLLIRIALYGCSLVLAGGVWAWADLVPRFEHKVSDHLPLWVRLPLPTR